MRITPPDDSQLATRMRFVPLEIPDVVRIEPAVFSDARGFFVETFHRQQYEKAGLPTDFVQDNHSGSTRGVLRGLHYQIRQPQGKLVRMVAGEIFDVAVDLRRSSRSFGRWVGARLSAESREQLWIPPGFAHGFYVLSDWAEVFYKATDYYAPQWERSLLWNDPSVGVEWPVSETELPILSEKDIRGTPLAQAEVYD
jgi:dTDP-4-dehydrorhamnose 3,5-epimerase